MSMLLGPDSTTTIKVSPLPWARAGNADTAAIIVTAARILSARLISFLRSCRATNWSAAGLPARAVPWPPRRKTSSSTIDHRTPCVRGGHQEAEMPAAWAGGAGRSLDQTVGAQDERGRRRETDG